MLKLLVVLALIAVVVLVARALRSRASSAADPAARGRARSEKLAADQAVIGRQGGQGMNQGGAGGGFGG